MEKTVVVRVEGLSHDGRGVGRVENKTIFVENALPGQYVRVSVEKEKARFAEGKVLEVLEKSPVEQKAPCPHAGTCGGCPWMKLPYEEQIRWKKQLVEDALTRIGKIRLPQHTSFYGADLEATPLRNKMEFAFAQGLQGSVLLGLRERASHTVVEVTDCMMQSPQGKKALLFIRRQVQELATRYGLPAWDNKSKSGFWRMLVLREAPANYGEARILAELITAPPQTATEREAVKHLAENLMAQPFMRGFVFSCRKTANDIAQGEKTLLTKGETTWQETVNLGHSASLFPLLASDTPENSAIQRMPAPAGSLNLTLGYNTFYQVNSRMAEKIYDNVIYSLKPYGPFKNIWDVYCGIGGFALSAARTGAAVHGFESVGESVALAKENARVNNLPVSFTQRDAASLGDRLAKYQPDLVIADPPRSGMDEAFVKALIKYPPRMLALVSCNPATLARDAAFFVSLYEPVELLLFDMFAHSQHVESVLLLRRV